MAKQELLGILNLVKIMLVKFSDEQADSKAMRSSYLGRQTLGFLLKNVKLRF